MKTAIPATETIKEGQTAVVYSKSAFIGAVVNICRSWMLQGTKAIVGKPIAKGVVTGKKLKPRKVPSIYFKNAYLNL